MINFATDSLAPQERFEHWRELRAKYLFGVTIEVAPDRRMDFVGAFNARPIGGAMVSELRATSYRVSRTSADIARIAGNSMIIGVQLRGGGTLRTANSAEHISAGDMTINHSDLPYSATPDGDGAFHCRMLKIPLNEDLLMGAMAEDLVATRPRSNSPLLRPIQALFNLLTLPGRQVQDPAREVANITRLALASRGRLPLASPEVRQALRSGLLRAGLEIMEHEKFTPDLSPASVAARLGISRRQLFKLFEQSDLSFARTVSAMRIRAARDLLLARPSLTIIDIAYGCGFESLATFYRAFHAAYGVAPRDIRLSGGAVSVMTHLGSAKSTAVHAMRRPAA